MYRRLFFSVQTCKSKKPKRHITFSSNAPLRFFYLKPFYRQKRGDIKPSLRVVHIPAKFLWHRKLHGYSPAVLQVGTLVLDIQSCDLRRKKHQKYHRCYEHGCEDKGYYRVQVFVFHISLRKSYILVCLFL